MYLTQTSKQLFGSGLSKAAKGHEPLDSGWHKDSDHFATDWMSGDPVPTTVLELLSCLNIVMSTSYLQLPGKWFEVHKSVQASRL